MAGSTGDLTGVNGSIPVAVILVSGSVVMTFISSWFNRRPRRRRTEPAPTPIDVLSNAKRITALEQVVADLRKDHNNLDKEHAGTRATVEALHDADQDRFKRIEEAVWPRIPPTH